MKKQLIAVLSLVAVVVMVAVSDYADAYMRKTTEEIDNNFIPAEVTCDVIETFDETSGIKSSVQVKNTGNISSYIRLRIVSYYVDSEGEIQFVPSPKVNVNYNKSDWFIDAEEDTYYYRYPVVNGENTAEFLAEGATIKLGSYTANSITYYQVVEIVAEAIQAEPAKSVESAWPVKVDAETGCISLK